MSAYSRGYAVARERTARGAKFVCSCFNCEHYGQGARDASEACRNPAVLEYDMVVEGGRIYCIQWQPVQKRSGATAAKKQGRFVPRKKG